MNDIEKEIQEIIELKKKNEIDNIYYKEIIKNKLINNTKIIHSLNNSQLDEECPSDYMGENIRPYYMFPETQTIPMHYICFETSFNEVPKYNNALKVGQVIFYILCDVKDIFDKQTGIARHDLLSALIIDEFNWSNMFGTQIRLISDKPAVVDTYYAGRTLIFEQTTPNSIVKNGVLYNTSRMKNGN